MSDLRVTNLKGRTVGSAPILPDGVVITGVATAGTFSGNLTGTATGLSGTPNLNVGIITSSSGPFQVGASTSTFIVTGIGSVGIGTTNPISKLDLFGSSTQSIVAIAASDINCSLGNYFIDTVNGNKTYTVSGVVTDRAYSFSLELTHTSGTITWFSGVEWPNSTAPTLTTGKTHLFMFLTDNGGSRWRASSLINYTN